MKPQRIRLAILGLWLGAMTFFSFVVAPAAFSALPTQQLAGALVSRTLSALEIIGVVLGGLLILVLSLSKERGKAALFEMIALVLMTAAMFVSHFAVSNRLHEIRVQSGEIAKLDAGDPTRAEFDRLHQYSVWLMSFNIVGAATLIVILSRRSQSQ